MNQKIFIRIEEELGELAGSTVDMGPATGDDPFNGLSSRFAMRMSNALVVAL